MNDQLIDTKKFESVSIIDLGISNVNSIKNMLSKIQKNSIIISKPSEVFNNSTIILPGVGSYDSGCDYLKKYGWNEFFRNDYDSLNQRLIGICLGMQLLCEGSEEGNAEGLGLIDGHFVKFQSSNVKVPHMGWSKVNYRREVGNFENENQRYYFVHSYYYNDIKSDSVVATSNYGVEFGAVLKKNGVIGAQFHPEKSHHYGMNFFKWVLNHQISDYETK